MKFIKVSCLKYNGWYTQDCLTAYMYTINNAAIALRTFARYGLLVHALLPPPVP